MGGGLSARGRLQRCFDPLYMVLTIRSASLGGAYRIPGHGYKRTMRWVCSLLLRLLYYLLSLLSCIAAQATAIFMRGYVFYWARAQLLV